MRADMRADTSIAAKPITSQLPVTLIPNLVLYRPTPLPPWFEPRMPSSEPRMPRRRHQPSPCTHCDPLICLYGVCVGRHGRHERLQASPHVPRRGQHVAPRHFYRGLHPGLHPPHARRMQAAVATTAASSRDSRLQSSHLMWSSSTLRCVWPEAPALPPTPLPTWWCLAGFRCGGAALLRRRSPRRGRNWNCTHLYQYYCPFASTCFPCDVQHVFIEMG